MLGALKLVRISALPSALADVFGGSALALAVIPWFSSAQFAREKLPWLLLTTVGIYLGGMGLNDVLHRHKDAAMHKPRPIVTGAISVEAATLLTSALYALGLLGAVIAGCGPQALVLALGTLIYNLLALGKVERGIAKLSMGPALIGVAVLGACRAIHVSLPLWALAGDQGWHLLDSAPHLLQAYAGVLVYFSLLTAVSLYEDRGGGAKALWTMQLGLLPAIFKLPLWALMQGERAHWLLEDLLPMAILATLYLWLARAFNAARKEPTPRNLGRCVGLGIRGECLVMAAFALAVLPQEPMWGTAAILCFPAATLMSKWVSPT